MLFSRSSEQKAQIKVLDVDERSRDCSEDEEGVGHTQETCSQRAGPAGVGPVLRSGGGCGAL